MKQTKEVFSDGFYIFESRASANSNYIENIKEAKQLLTYARYYLKSYLVIHDYVITRDGWQMAIQLTINSQNRAHDNVEEENWRIISERIRLWLSTYVKRINYWRNRKGVLVRDNYRRYYFESLDEALGHLKKMRKQQIKLYEGKKKYRGRKSHYKIDKILENGSIFLCSRELYSQGSKVMEEIGSELFEGFQDLVGPEMIKSTLKNHISQFKYQNKMNSS